MTLWTRIRPWRPAVVAFIALLASAGQAGTEPPDTRTPIPMTGDAREQVLREMRHFLEGVATITDALSREDMETVARTARGLGMAAAGGMPPEVRHQLPRDFRTMGRETHLAFDELALDAEQLGDADHSLKQLGNALGRCIACHRSFRFVNEGEQAH